MIEELPSLAGNASLGSASNGRQAQHNLSTYRDQESR
jgi:hypothetical protein